MIRVDRIVHSVRGSLGFRLPIGHIDADIGAGAETGACNYGVAVMSKIYVFSSRSVRIRVPADDRVPGEGQRGVCIGGNGPFGRFVPVLDAAAGHCESLIGFNIDRAALLGGKVCGHGAAGYGHSTAVVYRAALCRFVIGENRRAGDRHSRIFCCVNCTAISSGGGLFVALARYNRLSDVVLKGAAGDSSRGQGRESAAVHCPVAADAAAGVHGEGGTFAHGNTAAIAAGRVAFTVLCSTDASTQDQIGPGIDRATVARGCIAGQRCSSVQVYACAGGSIDRAAVAAGGLAAGDGTGRGNGGKALRGIHTAARRSPAVGNGSVHRKGRAGIQPNRAAVTGGHGVLQRRGAADRQAHRACHIHDAAVRRVGGDRLKQTTSTVKDNLIDGQRAMIHDHAAFFKAAIDRSNIAISIVLPFVVGIIRIRRQSRGQGDGFAAVEDRRPFHGVLRYHHFDAQGPGYGAIAGGSEVSAVDLVKGILQMSEDRRLQVAGRVPVIQQRAASVGDLADDLQEAVRKGHLRGINRLLRAFHGFGRGLFADRAFLLYGIHRFGAILGHLGADVGPLGVCEDFLHGVFQIGGQALDRERFVVHEAESFRHALYEAQRSVGLIAFSVFLYGLTVLADACVLQGQRERKALVHVRLDFADDPLGNSKLPGLAGVGENRLGKAGGILCAYVLTQLSGYGQRFIIRKGIGSSVLLRRRRVILCRNVGEDLCHLIAVMVKVVRENRRCGFSRFQRHHGDTVRVKAHAGDEAALCRRQ